MHIKQHMIGIGQGWPFVDRGTVNLANRIEAYKHVFPDRPVKEDCPCVEAQGDEDLNSPLFP